MPHLTVRTTGDGAIPEAKAYLDTGNLHHVPGGGIISSLEHGMASGKTSIALFIELGTGQAVLWETSLELLEGALRAFRSAEAGRKERREARE